MSAPALKAHKPFTASTWADHELRGLAPATAPARGWMAQADLAHELAARVEHIDLDTARVLVEAATSGLPVELTWEVVCQDRDRTISRTTATVIITQLFGPSSHSSGRIYHRRWGFSGPIAVDALRSARVHRTTYDRA